MPAEPVTLAGTLDSRQSRTARSRLAICNACLDLVQEGTLRPSADQIAERSGVSRRSIFNHFGDLAELYDAVVEAGMERCAPLLTDIAAKGSAAERLTELVRVRTRFLEATSAFTLSLTAQVLVGPEGEQALRVSRGAVALQHEEIERLFGPDLHRSTASERAEILEAMSNVVSPLGWQSLRHNRGKSVARARAILHRSLRAILKDAGVDV